MVVHFLPENKKASPQETCRAWHKGCDGIISEEELMSGLRGMRVHFADKEMSQITSGLANNERRGLALSEFMLGCVDKSEFERDSTLKRCYEAITKDLHGKVTFAQFELLFGDLECVNKDAWRGILTRFSGVDKLGIGHHKLTRTMI